MRGGIVGYIFLFVAIVLAQSLVFDHIEPGWGIHIMIYPMFILMLPFEIRPAPLMFIAFLLGITLDAYTNSFGLHASSAVFLAYIRNEIYTFLAGREGYESNRMATYSDMGGSWFIRAYGLTILAHHFVFFTLEVFKVSDFFFIPQKTLLSTAISLVCIALIQLIFFNGERKS